MLNVYNYIGIDYLVNGRDRKGLDCFGLAYLVYKENLSIDLGLFNDCYKDVKEVQNISNLINTNKHDFIEVKKPRKYDLILFNIMGFPAHIGIMIDDFNFIHILSKKNVTIESTKSISWAKRIEGFYRHAKVDI